MGVSQAIITFFYLVTILLTCFIFNTICYEFILAYLTSLSTSLIVPLHIQIAPNMEWGLDMDLEIPKSKLPIALLLIEYGLILITKALVWLLGVLFSDKPITVNTNPNPNMNANPGDADMNVKLEAKGNPDTDDSPNMAASSSSSSGGNRKNKKGGKNKQEIDPNFNTGAAKANANPNVNATTAGSTANGVQNKRVFRPQLLTRLHVANASFTDQFSGIAFAVVIALVLKLDPIEVSGYMVLHLVARIMLYLAYLLNFDLLKGMLSAIGWEAGAAIYMMAIFPERFGEITQTILQFVLDLLEV